MANASNSTDPVRQDQPRKNNDISSKVLKWLIFECVFVLILFFIMIVILLVRARYPEEQATTVQRNAVSGDVFRGDMGALSGNQRTEYVRNVLDGEVTIVVDGEEPVSVPNAGTAGKSLIATASARLPSDYDPSVRGTAEPAPGSEKDASSRGTKQDPGVGRIDSVITTKTITEYRGNVLVETFITTEERGDTTIETTVVTETKNGVVIRKTTTESTTTVVNGQSEQKQAGSN